MPQYSEQDLRYAAELRDSIHQEALEIVRRTRPGVTEVIDRHPVEDYFQQSWEYPGRWYTVVAIPYGYRGRRVLVDAIVRDTLAGSVPAEGRNTSAPDGKEARRAVRQDDDPFYGLIADYPRCAVDYCIVKPDGPCPGYESHRAALRKAWQTISAPDEDGESWQGDPDLAAGKQIPSDALFSANEQKGKLNYRRAFLRPPHGSGCTGRDFDRVNAALFPKGTDKLEVYEWSTDWSDYFDDGREWWGTLCLTVFDKNLDRFVVILASATD